MLLKMRNPANIRNGLLGFITLAFILRWKRVCIAHTLRIYAHRYGQPICTAH